MKSFYYCLMILSFVFCPLVQTTYFNSSNNTNATNFVSFILKSINKISLDVNEINYNNFTNLKDIADNSTNFITFETYLNYIHPRVWTCVLIAFHIMVFVIGLVGNCLVCVAVYRNDSMRTVTNFCIVNLALADFMVILFCLPPSVIWDVTITWWFGTATCKFVLYMQSVSITVSVLTLTFISIDRWYAICYPLKFKSTTFRAKTAIGIIWIIAMTCEIPEPIYLTTIPFHKPYLYLTQCEPTWSTQTDLIFLLVKMIFFYVIPLIFMSVAYVQIIKVLWKSGKAPHMAMNLTGNRFRTGRICLTTFTMNTNASTESQLRSRKKAAKMLVVVVIMFAICFFPVYVLWILRLTVKSNTNNPNTAFSLISHWLCYANSAINPIIYNFMSDIASKIINTDDYGKLIFWGAYVFLTPLQLWPGNKLDWKRKLFLIVQVILYTFTFFCIFAYIYENFSSFKKYSYAICILIVPLTAYVKMIFMVYTRNKLKCLAEEIMLKFWPHNVINENSYFKICFKAHNLTWICLLIIGICLCGMLVLAPIVNHERILPFPTSLPYNFTSSPSFEILYSMQLVTFQFLVHFTIAGNNLLILAYLLATSQQYYILRSCFAVFDTDMMFEVNKKLRVYSDKLELKYDERREFVYRCVKQHQMLLRFTNKLNATLNPLELSELVVSIIAICFGILRITNIENNNKTDVFISLAYLTAYVFQLSVDCYLGTYLFYQGSLLPDSIFHCNWKYLEDTNLRKDLTFILLHSQRIPQLSSYGLYNMNMESFLKVLKAAFSFYTMMSKIGQ